MRRHRDQDFPTTPVTDDCNAVMITGLVAAEPVVAFIPAHDPVTRLWLRLAEAAPDSPPFAGCIRVECWGDLATAHANRSIGDRVCIAGRLRPVIREGVPHIVVVAKQVCLVVAAVPPHQSGP